MFRGCGAELPQLEDDAGLAYLVGLVSLAGLVSLVGLVGRYYLVDRRMNLFRWPQ